MQTLISTADLQARIADLRSELAKNKYDYAVCVLNGAYQFFSMLTMTMDVNIDFVKVKSYVDTKSTGNLQILLADFDKFNGKTVLLVDDICDSGLTLSSLRNKIISAGATSVDTCVLLNKPNAHNKTFEPNYHAFNIGNEFVIGFGLDYNEKYRTLPYIAVL